MSPAPNGYSPSTSLPTAPSGPSIGADQHTDRCPSDPGRATSPGEGGSGRHQSPMPPPPFPSGYFTRRAAPRQRRPGLASACPFGRPASKSPPGIRAAQTPGSPQLLFAYFGAPSQLDGGPATSPMGLRMAWTAADDGEVRSTLRVRPPS
ncbi:hypothetical protein NDU88_002069 [Pleurodeles waltl]|uniref:Uncharacterized protein n=1 Tax=Pleurodeles waltl TaxID=8319 RepID=A0AAV7WNU2_PLEWA|nr:hypothetical protein NDU88_002069 [Pleurodeles waltl]